MTGLSRAAERAARRQRRRDNIRMVIAGFCVTAGVILFVTTRVGHSNDSADAHAPTEHTTAPSTGSGQSSDPGTSTLAGTPTTAPVPIVTSAGDATGPAAFTNPGVVNLVVTAASDGVEAINSYDYRDLNAAITAGLAATTGAFQGSYRTAMTGAVAATAPVTHTVQHCTVLKIGISSIADDLSKATALVFGRLTTTDTTTGATPRTTSITLGVTLQSTAGSWLISAVTDFSSGSTQARPPGTAALADAAIAGAREVVNLLSLSRATYDADFDRGLSGLTGSPRTQQEGLKDSLLATLNTAHVDYVGAIRSIGIETADPNAVLMLVAATSYDVGASGQRSVQSLPDLEIQVVRIDGTWLVDQVQSIATD